MAEVASLLVNLSDPLLKWKCHLTSSFQRKQLWSWTNEFDRNPIKTWFIHEMTIGNILTMVMALKAYKGKTPGSLKENLKGYLLINGLHGKNEDWGPCMEITLGHKIRWMIKLPVRTENTQLPLDLAILYQLKIVRPWNLDTEVLSKKMNCSKDSETL